MPHEKWSKDSRVPENGSIDRRQQQPSNHQPNYEAPIYKSKLLKKSPSMRAITNYNNLSINDNNLTSYDNLTFLPETANLEDYYSTYPRTSKQNTDTILNGGNPTSYEFNTNGPDSAYGTSKSFKTTSSSTTTCGSELGSEKNEMGSTAKLVSAKMEMPCQTWFTHLETFLCTISIASGFGNLYRLPQTTFLRGGLPFLIVYIIQTVLIGLPLLFLELGIGQLAQEGFIKQWRAVPFFRGVGYVKLIAGCLLSIYYPLYMGLSLYYIIWTAAKSIPFPECAVVKMTQDGYSADGIDGQQCLKKTFLESPFSDPYWYGIFAALLFLIWVVVIILSIRRTKSFITSLSILLFPVVGCLIALTVKSIFVENETNVLRNITSDVDWTILQNADIWYYGSIQVFFSTIVGFGTFVTNAGIIYNKVNPLWTALGYITINLVFGVGTVLILYILFGSIRHVDKSIDMPEVHLLTTIYTVLISNNNSSTNTNISYSGDLKIWAIVAYATFLLAGFISMATITYTLLKAITVQNGRRLKWWQTSIVLGFIGLFLGCCILLESQFHIVRLLDHYIVGNFILISVIVEVFALIGFYGTDRIRSDFEFMLGHILSKIWLILWWFLPLLLTAIFAWSLITLPNQDNFINDPIWLTATGWGVVLTSVIFIWAVGCYTVAKQNGYSLCERFKASIKPSNKWGPKDPMQRHAWVQWNTKVEQGERDFTLKRKGTRDYTRSVKRNAKKSISELSANNESNSDYMEPMSQHKRPSSNNAAKTAKLDSLHRNTLRVTSLIDSLDPAAAAAQGTSPGPYANLTETGFKTNINPLSRTTSREIQETTTALNSNEYGTFRKGPYVIPQSSNITHVCHRRFSEDDLPHLV